MGVKKKTGMRVLYRLPDFPEGTARFRPAVITQDFGGCANLQVFLDRANDLAPDRPLGSCTPDGIATSVSPGNEVGQHSPQRV